VPIVSELVGAVWVKSRSSGRERPGAVSKPYSMVKQLAWRMANEGQIAADTKGHYYIPHNLNNRDNWGYRVTGFWVIRSSRFTVMVCGTDVRIATSIYSQVLVPHLLPQSFEFSSELVHNPHEEQCHQRTVQQRGPKAGYRGNE
jgi:hypothetical protein